MKSANSLFIKTINKNIVKVYLSVFGFISISISGYTQTFERVEHGPRKVRNERDHSGRRQGNWKYYYPNGDIRAEITYLNNLMEGPYKKYYYLEKIKLDCNYFAGKLDGEYKKYFESDQVQLEGQYDMGIRNGKWIEYYETGAIKREMEFKKGVRHGNWKIFSKKGDVIFDVTYIDGKDINAPPPLPPAPKIKPEQSMKGKTNSNKPKPTVKDSTKIIK